MVRLITEINATTLEKIQCKWNYISKEAWRSNKKSYGRQ